MVARLVNDGVGCQRGDSLSPPLLPLPLCVRSFLLLYSFLTLTLFLRSGRDSTAIDCFQECRKEIGVGTCNDQRRKDRRQGIGKLHDDNNARAKNKNTFSYLICLLRPDANHNIRGGRKEAKPRGWDGKCVVALCATNKKLRKG